MHDDIAHLNAALSGRYHVERELGEGGMATVYLAHDLKHERNVALKVLKPELAAAVGAARFLAEIRTTASLQHPHILPLFDSGEAAGSLFYVMPRVQGESLGDRLAREHQLPVDEAIRIATALAQALDYAHRHGVVHRDIKSSNILMHEGNPVIADFGISLALNAGSGGRLTETGLSLGTPQYMSPEQAMGEPVGAATDIYALGCVLYEMLVGEPPFKGSSPQAILAKVLTGEPVSATAQRRLVPLHVDSVIRRALEQLPADRFASASEFARALTDRDYRHGVPAVADASHARWRRAALGLSIITGVLAIVSAWSLWAARRPQPRPVVRSFVTPVEGQRWAAGVGDAAVALSSDGSWMVYVGEAPGGARQLWRRELKELLALPIPGTIGASSPVVSPDGSAIAFTIEGSIRVVSLSGGPPVTVATSGSEPAWSDDGMIFFTRDGVVFRVPAAGGKAAAFTSPIENVVQQHVSALPDGQGLVLTGFMGTPAQARIFAVGPDGGEPKEVVAGVMARYSDTGHLVYTTAAGTLWAAPFDTQRLQLTGPPVALVEGVAVDQVATSQFALAPSGTLVYGTGAGFVSELVWVNRAGVASAVDPEWKGEFGSPALSPDGRRVAVAIQGQTSMDIWIKQLDRGPSTRLTLDGARNDYPTWTPDGTSVTFTSDRKSPSFDLWTKPVDRSGEPVLEIDQSWAVAEAQWSPDGQWLLHRTSTNVRGAGDIVGQRGGKQAATVPLVATPFTELGPIVSPNGRWMAYTSNETGRREVFVVPFPNVGDARWPVSVGGGGEPLWSRDGRELFYRNSAGALVSARVEGARDFVVGATRVLFPATDYVQNMARRQYDVSADGERFLFIRSVGAGREGRLILVQNFAEEIRRNVRD